MMARSVLVAWLVVVSTAAVFAQGDPWFRQSPKPKDFVTEKLPWNTFTIEMPKNWLLVPGFGGTLFTRSERGKANQTAGSIALEQSRLVEPLTPNDIDENLAELEGSLANTRDPSGTNFTHQVKEVDGRRFVLMTYTRPGLNGPDSVVIYAFPNGRVMYRLICIAPGSEIQPKYQAMFAHVAASFRTANASSN